MKTNKKNEQKVWVELEVNKYTDGISILRGQMKKSDLEAWMEGELIDCAIKLERVYWFLDQETLCVLGKGEGPSIHYTGEVYVRVDTIMLIYLLREDSCFTSVENENNIFHFPGRKMPVKTN